MSGVILLPGMGADRRLFAGLEGEVPFVVPEWPSHVGCTSIAALAHRIAGSLSTTPSVVGGASFGGMVALELAPIVGAKAVVLMGSCRGPGQVAAGLRLLGLLAPVVPASAYAIRGWNKPLLNAAFGPLGSDHARILHSMAQASSSSFIKWACRAVLRWEPASVTVPVFHVHGGRDRIIPARRVDATEVIPEAGHLLNLTHSAEVTAFLHRALEARRS